MHFLLNPESKTENLRPRKQMLFPYEPQIWKLQKKDVRTETYKTFSLGDLFDDLFKTKNHTPLIVLTDNPIDYKTKDYKLMMDLILPSDLVDRILQYKNKKGQLYILRVGNNNDFKWSFILSGENHKIFNLIHEFFSQTNGKEFISCIQQHIIKLLSTAEMSDIETLKSYLESIGNNLIVPFQESSHANTAFKNLYQIGDKYSISLIIANFFISALLGLFPLNHDGQDKTYFKAYVLNALGMEYIWTPEIITTSYEKLQDIILMYRRGEYRAVYLQICQWLTENEGSVSDSEKVLAYQIVGTCLVQHPDGCNLDIPSFNNDELLKKRRSVGAEYLEKSLSLGNSSSEIHYVLYEYYSDDDIKKSSLHLTEAFIANHPNAIIEYITLCLKDPNTLKEVSDKQKIEKLTYVIDNCHDYSDNQVGNCFYLRGLIYKKNGEIGKTETDFVQAAKLGNDNAKCEISRKARLELHSNPSFSNNPESPCCFVNSLSGHNCEFVSSLPNNEWSLYSTEESLNSEIQANKVSNIQEFIQIQQLENSEFKCQHIVFLFLSKNEEKNLNECLLLLDKLYNIALEISETQRHHLIDAIDIYIEANYETSSMLIDANINDMGSEIYFKVHIVDEVRDSVHQLLCDAPLFLPYLNTSNQEDEFNVVLFGCSKTNYCFIKESIACAFLGKHHPISITLLGTNANNLERKLRQECPGIYSNPKISCIRPDFISCCIEETDFPSLIYGDEYANNPDNPIVKILSCGNYFVVDLENDYDSIKFAMELRTWLLRSRGTFDRTPFIALKCGNSQNSYLATHLTLASQAEGNTYYSKYDLFPFGITKELYSYHHLIKNPKLETVALRIHKSYAGENERQAENNYYSFSYNSDSSVMTAIGLNYRLFAGGAFFSKRENYLHYGFFESKELLDIYLEYCSNEKKRDIAAALEQSRWNGFMLSRGWESADKLEVQSYKNQATGSSHKHTLAKLHPFIREWDDLDGDDLKSILGILKIKFDYRKHPQETTRQSIDDTERFLTTDIEQDKTH